mmetsp:Transcript_87350/g.138648  ORF Transcript_87350/g.138648 Transcript_87350/m.138648 type:complete len:234 (-) Transcript_87350:7-708(-)
MAAAALATATVTVSAITIPIAIPITATASTRPHICGLVFALSLVVFLVISHLVSFLYAGISFHESRHVGKKILATVIWLDEAKALVAVPADHSAYLLSRLVATHGLWLGPSFFISMPTGAAAITSFPTSVTASSLFPPDGADLRQLPGGGQFDFRRAVFSLAIVPFLRVQHVVALHDATLTILEIGDVAEHVLAIVLWLNEAESLLSVPSHQHPGWHRGRSSPWSFSQDRAKA